jgi:hypothetical protein
VSASDEDVWFAPSMDAGVKGVGWFVGDRGFAGCNGTKNECD